MEFEAIIFKGLLGNLNETTGFKKGEPDKITTDKVRVYFSRMQEGRVSLL